MLKFIRVQCQRTSSWTRCWPTIRRQHRRRPALAGCGAAGFEQRSPSSTCHRPSWSLRKRRLSATLLALRQRQPFRLRRTNLQRKRNQHSKRINRSQHSNRNIRNQRNRHNKAAIINSDRLHGNRSCSRTCRRRRQRQTSKLVNSAPPLVSTTLHRAAMLLRRATMRCANARPLYQRASLRSPPTVVSRRRPNSACSIRVDRRSNVFTRKTFGCPTRCARVRALFRRS